MKEHTLAHNICACQCFLIACVCCCNINMGWWTLVLSTHAPWIYAVTDMLFIGYNMNWHNSILIEYLLPDDLASYSTHHQLHWLYLMSLYSGLPRLPPRFLIGYRIIRNQNDLDFSIQFHPNLEPQMDSPSKISHNELTIHSKSSIIYQMCITDDNILWCN